MSISVDKPKMTGIKPLQAIPYSEKDENWRKQNIEYYICLLYTSDAADE